MGASARHEIDEKTMEPRHVVGEPVRRVWTRKSYHQLAEAGFFGPDEKLELIEGDILTLSPVGSQHSITVLRTFQFLAKAFGSDFHVNIQQPIVLNDLTEPEPDIIVAKGESTLYEDHHPRPDELLLVVEVSDTTLQFDRTHKSALYSANGIPEYWIVKPPQRQVEVFRQPESGSNFHSNEILSDGQMLSSVQSPETTIQISDLLPRKRNRPGARASALCGHGSDTNKHNKTLSPASTNFNSTYHELLRPTENIRKLKYSMYTRWRKLAKRNVHCGVRRFAHRHQQPPTSI